MRSPEAGMSEILLRYVEDSVYRCRIDEIFSLAEPEVEDFCHTHSIGLDKWYHDLPIWFLHWDNNLQRGIQIGTSSISGGLPVLSVFAGAYKEDPVTGVSYDLPIWIFSGYIIEEEVRIGGSKLNRMLVSAKTNADNVKQEDLILLN